MMCTAKGVLGSLIAAGLLAGSATVFGDEIGPSTDGQPVIIQGTVTHWSPGETITGTVDQERYEEEIYAQSFSAVVDGLPAGLYSVDIYVAEHYADMAGVRVFSISSGSTAIAENLDIYAEVGKNAEYVVTGDVNVTDGTLELLFEASANNAKLNALVVRNDSGTAVAGLKVKDLVPYQAVGVMRDITPMEMVAEMGIGTNLGNTLDTRNENKTYWGNPETTEAIIDGMLGRGFGTLRIPVTWEHDMNAAYVIQPSFLNRVEEIANWALDNDVYVIINSHHDGNWIVPTYAEIDTVTNNLYTVWSQIAEHFKEYGDHLLFETLNEPRVEGGGSTWGEWSGGTAETRACVNLANKACVEAIRATGGNNAVRKIMVPTHAASAETVAQNAWVAPHGDPNIIVSMHAYSPWSFCGTANDPDWGTAADRQALDNLFDGIYNRFVVGQGRAVVMGEWGERDFGLGNEADRARHAEYYANACIDRGFCPVYWDDGGGFKVYDRDNLTWHAPIHADAILSPYFGVPFDLYELTEELQLGRLGDDDGDGEANLYEFATGGDATDAAVQGYPMEITYSDGNVALITARRKDRNMTGLQYAFELSDNLVSNTSWSSVSVTASATNAVPGSEDYEEVVELFDTGAGAPANGFFRLTVEE